MDQGTSKWYINFFKAFLFLSFFTFAFFESLERKKKMQVSLWASVKSSALLLFCLVPVLLFIHGVGDGVLQLHEI